MAEKCWLEILKMNSSDLNRQQVLRARISELAEKLYPRISETTEAALDFNDKYDCDESEISEDLGNDLSRLGEELAVRVELEDQLLSAMRR